LLDEFRLGCIQWADGNGSASTSLFIASTRWICSSATVQSNLPFSGSTDCYFAANAPPHDAGLAPPDQKLPRIGG
jgi:hypothetical protein